MTDGDVYWAAQDALWIAMIGAVYSVTPAVDVGEDDIADAADDVSARVGGAMYPAASGCDDARAEADDV